jgi:hypothetical protein
VIEYRCNISETMNWWIDAAVPIGPTVTIRFPKYVSYPPPAHYIYPDNEWFFASGSMFNWKVKELRIIGSSMADYMLVDALTLPIEMYACCDYSEGGRKYIAAITRFDILTQKELQAYANSICYKRKTPLQRLSLNAVGDVGLIGGAWKWLPGYRVTVNIPTLGLNNVEYRFMEIHHIIERPGEFGWMHRVEVGMVPATAPLETLRWTYSDKGDIAVMRQLRDRVRALEQMLNIL